MIAINIGKKGSKICVHITGHAGSAQKGKDIVCAGVSTTQYILENYVKDCCTDVRVSDINEEDGYAISFSVKKKEKVRAVEAILTGFYALENEYPEYVNVYEIRKTN